MIPLFLRFCQSVFGSKMEVNRFSFCLKLTDDKQEKQIKFNLFHLYTLINNKFYIIM